MLMVETVRGSHIDHIHLVIGSEGLITVVDKGNGEFPGKLPGGRPTPGSYGHQFGICHPAQVGSKFSGDAAAAQDAPSDLLMHDVTYFM